MKAIELNHLNSLKF